jgi:hypothetical protein
MARKHPVGTMPFYHTLCSEFYACAITFGRTAPLQWNSIPPKRHLPFTGQTKCRQVTEPMTSDQLTVTSSVVSGRFLMWAWCNRASHFRFCDVKQTFSLPYFLYRPNSSSFPFSAWQSQALIFTCFGWQCQYAFVILPIVRVTTQGRALGQIVITSLIVIGQSLLGVDMTLSCDYPSVHVKQLPLTCHRIIREEG